MFQLLSNNSDLHIITKYNGDYNSSFIVYKTISIVRKFSYNFLREIKNSQSEFSSISNFLKILLKKYQNNLKFFIRRTRS